MFKPSRFFFWSALAALSLVALTSGCLGGTVQYDPNSGKAAYVLPLGVSSPTPAPSIFISIPTIEPIKATATEIEKNNQILQMYATQTAIPVRQTEEARAGEATKVSMSVDATMQAVGAQSTQVAATQIADAVVQQQWEATQTAISEQKAVQSRADWEQAKETAAQTFIVGGIALAVVLVTLVTVDVRVREREAQTALLVAKAQADEQQTRLLAMHDRLAASITEAMPADLPMQKSNGNGHSNGNGLINGKNNGNGNGHGQNGAAAGQDHGSSKSDDSLRKPQQGRGSGNSNLPLAG